MMSADTRWAKSSYSFANQNCVEVARLPGVVAVRDSEDPGGPVLKWRGSTWGRFLTSLPTAKAGGFLPSRAGVPVSQPTADGRTRNV